MVEQATGTERRQVCVVRLPVVRMAPKEYTTLRDEWLSITQDDLGMEITKSATGPFIYIEAKLGEGSKVYYELDMAQIMPTLIEVVLADLGGKLEALPVKGSARPLDAQSIVEAWLVEYGYDGLFQPGECACKVGNLFSCGGPCGECQPGYLKPCDCGDHDYHVGPDRLPENAEGSDE